MAGCWDGTVAAISASLARLTATHYPSVFLLLSKHRYTCPALPNGGRGYADPVDLYGDFFREVVAPPYFCIVSFGDSSVPLKYDVFDKDVRRKHVESLAKA